MATRVRLVALEDDEELRATLAGSWRQAAPRRLADRHPEAGVPPES